MTQNELRLNYLQKLGFRIEQILVDENGTSIRLGYKVNNILVDENRTIIDLESNGSSYNFTLWGSDGYKCDDALKIHIDRVFCPYCKSNLTGKNYHLKLGSRYTCFQCGATQLASYDRIQLTDEESETGWLKNREFEFAPSELVDDDDVAF